VTLVRSISFLSGSIPLTERSMALAMDVMANGAERYLCFFFSARAAFLSETVGTGGRHYRLYDDNQESGYK